MISEDPTWVESTSERKTLQGVTRVGYQALLRSTLVKLDLTPCMPGCYVCCVLVEVRKQGVAGRMFRGASEPVRKVQQEIPPKSPSAVPPRRLGGKAKTCPLSSGELDGGLSRTMGPFPGFSSFRWPCPFY